MRLVMPRVVVRILSGVPVKLTEVRAGDMVLVVLV